MSVIKEIYDVVKDGSALASKAGAIKRALRAELKLNQKFLKEIERSEVIDNDRRVEIIHMLEIQELAAAVKYEIPYNAVSRKKITQELGEKYRIKRLVGTDFETLVESLYLMISYLKKDFNNKKIDLNLRLINIYKYNAALLELIT